LDETSVCIRYSYSGNVVIDDQGKHFNEMLDEEAQLQAYKKRGQLFYKRNDVYRNGKYRPVSDMEQAAYFKALETNLMSKSGAP